MTRAARVPAQAVDSLFHSRARGGAFKQGPQDKLYKLAELCRDSGMTDRMLNLLEAYLRLKPERPEAAVALALTGRYSEALARAAAHLASGKLTAEETFLLGNPWLNIHDRGIIGRALPRVAAAKASGPAARLKALHLFILRSRAGRAAGSPPFLKGRLSIMNAHCADALLAAGKAPEAARLLSETVVNFPADEYSCGKLAEALLCQGRAREAFALMKKKEPLLRSRGFYAWHGQLLLLAGRYSEAEAKLENSPAASSPMAPCWLGAAKLKLGKTGPALRLLRKAAANRSDLEAALWLAEALRLAGKPADALPEVRRVLDAAPAHPWGLLAGALLSSKTGRGPDAERLFAAFLEGPGKALKPPRRFSAAWAEAALERAGGCRRPESYFIAIAASPAR